MNFRRCQSSRTTEKWRFNRENVRAMLKKTSFAVSTDESRYVLNGIFVSLKEGKMTLVATDGRRLALVDEEVDISEKSSGEFIVPAKAVNELNRLLQAKGDVEMKFGENQASFSLKDDKGFSVLLVTKLIEGNYPNYRQVIPGEARERIPLVREEFLQALRRAEIMTSEKANSVKLTFGEKQPCHHRQLPRSRRSARNPGSELQRQGHGHRLQSALPH